MMPKNFKVDVGNLNLSGQHWGCNHSTKFPIPALAMHGWLDNSGSFKKLSQYLVELDLFAPDLAGHGESEYKSIDADYTIWSYIDELFVLADRLELTEFGLIGHSMGGGVSSLMAALFPERIPFLILLDSIGPLTKSPEESVGQMRKSIKSKIRLRKRYLESSKNWQKNHMYPDREQAITARTKIGLSFEAANVLGDRGIKQDQTGYYWGHDKRLVEKSVLSLTENHIAAFFHEICCPVLMITSQGSFIKKEILSKRLSQFKNVTHLELPGQHHQHMEAHAEDIGRIINGFIAGL